MASHLTSFIPNRAETLKVLQLMGAHQPILMLHGADDGFGTRWIIDGQQVQPVIARYLMDEGFIAEAGLTELGARTLALTPSGAKFRENGFVWWASLDFFERLKIIIFG
ncbi:hypothetical protein [Dechloromonas denitrificans]|uniref:hypothetical protein n=1 Tax=Dechloromonas denitrificans TaxID=281362 RepID=UPI001CF889C6|nr:hypothetical protein [Dechloromonas denitrificans]UCV03827.1 hypothetical protein KI611_00685 [Dechloromonas denitrificans]UCV08090.1 hypothetical protein KI615_00705 [Dechloromonas denitrificans]